MQQRTEARKRREKKKLAKMKSKSRERAALGATEQDPATTKEGVYAQEDDLFSLTSLRSKRALEKVADAHAPNADELEARGSAAGERLRSPFLLSGNLRNATTRTV